MHTGAWALGTEHMCIWNASASYIYISLSLYIYIYILDMYRHVYIVMCTRHHTEMKNTCIVTYVRRHVRTVYTRVETR